MNIPEGAATVTAEAADLKSAIAGAAQQLGLHPTQVDYKLDMSHFRSPTGVSLARSTVRIVAWGSGRDPRTEEAREPRRPRPERERREGREGRDKESQAPESQPQSQLMGDVNAALAEEGEAEGEDKRRRRRKKEGESRAPAAEAREAVPENGSATKPENLRGAESGVTEASTFAEQWFTALLKEMGVEGTAVGTGSADRVHLSVKAERAGRIVGKRGATLGSIRHMLKLALENRFGPIDNIDVDVGDDRPREDRDVRSERSDRPERGDRGERGERGDRGDRGARGDRGDRGRRDRDRGDRRGDRGRREGRGGSSDRGRYPEEKLRALARRAAEKALESGQTITINLELNSFDRRIVHLEVSEMDGVESQSEERTGQDGRLVKYVQIIPQRG